MIEIKCEDGKCTGSIEGHAIDLGFEAYCIARTVISQICNTNHIYGRALKMMLMKWLTELDEKNPYDKDQSVTIISPNMFKMEDDEDDID